MKTMQYIPSFFVPALMAAAMLFTATPVTAQEVDFDEISDSIEVADVAAVEEVDTVITSPAPEWYVAPIPYDSVFARHKVARRAAANCPIDSVLIFNVESVLTDVSIYEHGDTTRTITWTINSDGSRIGKTWEEYAQTSLTAYGAKYTWDNTTNDWKGVGRGDTVYDAKHNMTSRTIYAWIDNAWIPNTRYTYAYDQLNRQIEYVEYNRNTTTNELVPTYGWNNTYDGAGRVTLDIQYTAYSNNDWSAGTKNIYEYDPAGNQTLHEEYSSYSNGVWSGGVVKEISEYASKKKTFNQVYAWLDGKWVNSTMEVWHYNGPSKAQTFYEKHTWLNNAWVGSEQDTIKFELFGTKSKQTVHEHYIWSNGDWSISVQDSMWYDNAGNKTLDAKYTFTNGVRKGNGNRTEYILTGLKSTIVSKWSNGAWQNNKKTIKDNVLGTDTVENCTYTWQTSDGGYWKGSGTRTLKIAGGAEVINQFWNTNAKMWVNSTRTITIGSVSNPTQKASYQWQDGVWIGTARTDYSYYASGKPDTITTYRPIGTDWVDSLRTVNTYNAGTVILTENSKWNGTMWVMQTMTRTDIVDQTVDGIRQTLNASWRCESDTIWIGVRKDTSAYLATDKLLFMAQYTSWSNDNWVPSYIIEKKYGEADRLVLDQRFDLKNGVLQGRYKYETQYDGQGRKIMSASYDNWSIAIDDWTGGTKSEYVYDANGRKEKEINYTRSNNQWNNSSAYTYGYDALDREISFIIQEWNASDWKNTFKYEKEYLGTQLIKDNLYIWYADNWQIYTQTESIYDDDAQAKLRHVINGSWNSSGESQSFIDKLYFYACDPKSYTIRFENYDGSLLKSVSIFTGNTPEYTGETPTKPATAQYTYTFKNWGPALVEVTGNATYTAQFDSTINKYTITWLNDDNTQIDQTSVEYGVVPTHADATKANTAEYTYTFSGWNETPVAVIGDTTYTATFSATKNKYTITWLNDDNSQIDQTSVEYGVVPTHADATKENTAEWSYTFAGWDVTPVAVTGDTTYTATFNATKNKYTITWLNEDQTQIDQTTVEYGIVPTHADATKENTDEWTYTFAGWDVAPVAVTGDTTYTATFSAAKNKYTITWLNDDNSQIDQTSVEYGVVPTHADATKANTAEWTYTFAGWDVTPVAVIGDTTYTATFSATKNKYTITWLNEDNTQIDQTSVEYGVVPTHAEPTKKGDAQYSYTFAGWDVTPVAVTGAATYTATFSSTINSYTITFMNGDEIMQTHVLPYGTHPAYTSETPNKPSTPEYTYIFAGWEPAVTDVTGNATYTATYYQEQNIYTITFVDEDGVTELDRAVLAYGDTPTTDVIQTKPDDWMYSYTFAGWTPEVSQVTGNATYTATYTSTLHQYTITFLDEDGFVLSEQLWEYGAIPTCDEPMKPANAQYTYSFAGWDVEPVAVTGNATYVATYTGTLRQYTITFLDEDGAVLSEQAWNYGATPQYTGETPTKPETEQYVYTFDGWTPHILAVTGEATYTATYAESLRKYTITFVDDEGKILSEEEWEYGSIPSCATPTKPATYEYSYTFAGWTPEVTEVTEDAVYTATFTAEPISHEDVPATYVEPQATKILLNGQLFILRSGHMYTIDGVLIK